MGKCSVCGHTEGFELTIPGEFEYKGEFPSCECGGKFLPLISQHDTYCGGGSYTPSGRELRWKCCKCGKHIKD